MNNSPLFNKQGPYYINDFELIASIIPRETKELYVGYFMNGLHEEMKNQVRLMGSITRSDVFTTTRNVEVALGSKHGTRNISSRAERIEGGRGPVTSNLSFKNPGIWQPTQTRPTTSPNPPHYAHAFSHCHATPNPSSPISPPHFPQSPPHKGFQHLTRAEVDEGRRKGLCFKCGQTFSP